ILVEKAHLGTQPLKGLRELATNGSATNNCKPGGALSQIEYCFVGQVTDPSQSRDRRLNRARAGSNDRAFEAQSLSAYLNRIRTRKTRLTKEHIHPKLGKALR